MCSKRNRPGQYYHFEICEPKRRVISAAPYRDRVVHHAIHNILEPIFDPTFIHDSYATRSGKGTHAAIDRFQHWARQAPYVLKCDIQQYFPSIGHTVLLELVSRKIACADTLWLIQKILASHRTAETLHPSIHPSIHPRGIPIGNLTSQFFANIYLNGLDHYIKETLRCQYYLRYMDDFVVLHTSKAALWEVKKAIVQYLQQLGLCLHERKCRIHRTDCGVPFLGLVIFPHRQRLLRANVVRARRRLNRLQRLDQQGLLPWSRILQSIRAWIGHAQHANTWRLRELLLEHRVFRGKGG